MEKREGKRERKRKNKIEKKWVWGGKKKRNSSGEGTAGKRERWKRKSTGKARDKREIPMKNGDKNIAKVWG